MANNGGGVGNIDFAGLMQEVETLGVELPKARRPGIEVREEEAGPFGEGVRAVSDFCYAAGAQGEARPTPGECELHFNLAFVYGPEHVRKLYEAILGQTEALGYPGDWPREAGDSVELPPEDDVDRMPEVPEF